jgi:L-fucose isomerase-like protein
MDINLILFSSPLHGEIQLSPERIEIIEQIKKFGNVKISDEKSLNFSERYYEEGIDILYILTGGTEESFLNRFPFLSRPIIILSDGYDNSLAAALEICTSLFNNHIEHYHINAPLKIEKSFIKRLNDTMSMLKKTLHGQKMLSGMRIGLIGEASPWLIASGINKTTVQDHFKINFISIQVEELIEKYLTFSKNYTDSNTKEFAQEIEKMVIRYSSHLSEERTGKDLKKALIMYFAILDLCKKYNLNAVTVRCFSLIDTCETTACLALAILNDNGIIAGCEGDIPALLSMVSVSKLTHQPCFMANVSSIDRDNCSIDLSHCTVPLKMTSSFSLPSHFESKKGIGINGTIPEGNYTLFKFSGMNMEKAIICQGKIVKCDYLTERCRTQIRFVFDNKEDFNTFIISRIANHVIINKSIDI